MKLHLKDLIIGTMFLLSFLVAVFTSYKYKYLKTEFEKTCTQTVVDSLEMEIKYKNIMIEDLELQISQLNDSISSVEIKTIYIEKQVFKVSDNISEASELLKKNLSCVDL